MIHPAMKNFFLLILLLSSLSVFSQSLNYTDSLHQYREQYVDEHEVVKDEDHHWLQFYPIDSNFRIHARFEYIRQPQWFTMETSGMQKQIYRTYGKLTFRLHDTLIKLNVYQSQRLMEQEEYRDYLFLPFTDHTNGEGSYEIGRYIDLRFTDIHDNEVVLDFNKAYNPYCAYIEGRFNCPIPPSENFIPMAITAGEKKFSKPIASGN